MYVSCVLDVNVPLKDVVRSHFFNRLQFVCLLFFFKSNPFLILTIIQTHSR